MLVEHVDDIEIADITPQRRAYLQLRDNEVKLEEFADLVLSAALE
ncbi:MAG: hypothetical protein PHT88_04595 [Candidatus Moranbacteria bacterium]|nr:hypothetical protein [Candidatus Moranbacteria bacterium]